MTITPSAQEKLLRMRKQVGGEAVALRIEGIVGTCRGSTPILKPVTEPAPGDTPVEVPGIKLLLASDYAELLADATLDYDGSLMGRGLTLTWPHRDGCQCQCQK